MKCLTLCGRITVQQEKIAHFNRSQKVLSPSTTVEFNKNNLANRSPSLGLVVSSFILRSKTEIHLISTVVKTLSSKITTNTSPNTKRNYGLNHHFLLTKP